MTDKEQLDKMLRKSLLPWDYALHIKLKDNGSFKKPFVYFIGSQLALISAYPGGSPDSFSFLHDIKHSYDLLEYLKSVLYNLAPNYSPSLIAHYCIIMKFCSFK